ncbi:MAG: nucleotidyltransferase family protein [Candidatus Diapherotrites archaeon]|nr:nucleotidyltransferase family protein [Candidatus Diapherotrites archaeon]
MISQAFILAGGKGERLRPLTENIPKPMIPVKGKPILEWILENIAEYGVKEIILSVGYKHEKVIDYFGKEFNGMKINYAIEHEFLGTGGALKYSEKKLKEKFFMLNGDNLADLNFNKMEAEHNSSKCLATIALIEVTDPTHYGIAKLNEKKIIEFIEKPLKENAPSNLANAGAYIIEKKALEFLPSGFNLIEKTLFPKLAEMNLLNSFKHEGQWFATDTPEKYEKAKKEFNP